MSLDTPPIRLEDVSHQMNQGVTPPGMSNRPETNPKVSICLPNLNNRAYLPERLDSIFAQVFQDWELIVYDSHSDDGAWEYIQEMAAVEPRMKISQGAREGIYPAWNYCIRAARGEYIYMATSDDTMERDCLEKLVVALEAHPGCGLAHCCATFINAEGQPSEWKWESWPAVKYFGRMIQQQHVRPAGHDAVLALAFTTPYFSITQLLIRRSLFKETGLFQTQWGPFGDFEWQMRATLLTSSVHLPQYLATWRLHPEQASGGDRRSAAIRDGTLVRMADEIIAFSRRAVGTSLRQPLPQRLRRFLVAEQLFEHWKDLPDRKAMAWFLLRQILTRPVEALWFLAAYTNCTLGFKASRNMEVRKELKTLGIQSPTLESQVPAIAQ